MEGGEDEELDYDVNEDFQDDEDNNNFHRNEEEEEEQKRIEVSVLSLRRQQRLISRSNNAKSSRWPTLPSVTARKLRRMRTLMRNVRDSMTMENS